MTTTTDAVDAAPGDGTCATAAGDCSLRAAVQEANASAGPDTITLPAGTYTLTLAGADENDNETGDLDLTDSITIAGAGMGSTVLDGNGTDRVLDFPLIGQSIIIMIRDLTIRNGLATGNTPEDGGAIRVNSGSTTLERVALLQNTATQNGGGLHQRGEGTLVVLDSRIEDNTADVSGGGINAAGVETTITQTTIAENSAHLGGGVQVADATLTADAITVTGNSATDTGGGLRVFRSEMHVSNSTISGNRASGSSKGAGVHVASGLSTLRYVTIVGNTNGYGLSGPFEDALLEGVIIANNPTGDCDDRVRIQTVGSNLDSDGSCGFALTAPPQLGPLADNGGPTLTHALLAGSPAIDAATGCPPPATDQRGEPRPQGNGCDLGAFEAEPGQPPVVGPTRTIRLLSGFALLGWTGPDTPVAQAIAPIANVVLGIWTWEIPSQSFRFYSPTALAFLNSLETLRFGDGFWILVDRAVTWDMPVQQ